jgi:hypothetical protein
MGKLPPNPNTWRNPVFILRDGTKTAWCFSSISSIEKAPMAIYMHPQLEIILQFSNNKSLKCYAKLNNVKNKSIIIQGRTLPYCFG